MKRIISNNFINDLLEKVNKGESLAIASDQFGSPTSAKELARFIDEGRIG